MGLQISFGDKAPAWAHQIRSGLVPFFGLAYMDEADTFRQVSDLQPLVFDKGRIQFDRFTVKRPVFSEQSVTWAHQSNRGFTSGNMMYAKGGTELHGMVSIGDDAHTATEFHVFATALPLSEYATTLTTDGGDTTDGPILRIGLRAGQGMAPRISVFLDAVDVTYKAVQSLDAETGRPVLGILLSGIPDQPRLSGTTHIVFDIGDNGTVSFSGNIVDLNADGNVVVTRWTGQRREPVAVESALVEAETPPLAFVDAILPSGESAVTDAELEAPEVKQSILTILGMTPDDKEVAKASPQYLMENMKFAMWEDTDDDDVTSRRKWMENYFKERKPIINDQRRIDNIQYHARWYRETMATAIFGNSVADQVFDSKLVPRPIDDQRRETLKNYVQQSLGADSTYVGEQTALWRTVYFDKAPGLKRYAEQDMATVDSRSDASKHPTDWKSMTWGERVLRYATSEKQFKIIHDNLMAGNSTSDEDQTAEDLTNEITEMENKLIKYQEDIDNYQKNPSPENESKAIEARGAIKILKLTIPSLKNSLKSIEDKNNEKSVIAMMTMRNVSSLLHALDPDGRLPRVYVDGVGMFYIANSMGSAEFNHITGYEETLTSYIRSFLDDVAYGGASYFGKLNETGDLAALLKAERMTTLELSANVVRSLVNAGNVNFIESANNAAQTFSQQYPKLTGAFRVCLMGCYIFNFIRIIGTIQQGTGSLSTTEELISYASFSSLMVATVTSMAGNVKNLFTAIFQPLAPAAQQVGLAVAQFFNYIANGIANGVMLINQAVQHGFIGYGVAAVANNAIIAAVRSVFARVMGAVGSFVGWVRGKVVNFVGMVNQFAATPAWAGIANCLRLTYKVFMKALTIISCVVMTVIEGIKLFDLWRRSDASGWQKAVATLEFVAGATSAIATVVGLFATNIVWSGAGAILSLVAFGIGVIMNSIWPQESIIQKMISQVFVPFIDKVAEPELAKTNAAKATSKMRMVEEQLAEGPNLAFA